MKGKLHNDELVALNILKSVNISNLYDYQQHVTEE